VNVLFNDSGSWLDSIASVVDKWIMLCIVEELLTGQNLKKKWKKIGPISTLSTKNPT
jgi:hypothetical protein